LILGGQQTTAERYNYLYLIGVVHSQGNARAFKVVNIHGSGFATVLWSVNELELSWTRSDEICGPVLCGVG
jgi:hypothetical protein